jgi:hypothetical protein
MDGTWSERRVVAARELARGVHAFGISAQQRLHFAAVLIVVFCAGTLRAQDISFNPAITDAEFQQFSRLVAQGIFPTPVQPARVTGFLGFDVGVAATAVKVDTSAPYWQHSVGKDFSTGGYVAVPRLVASKGFASGTISGSYAKVNSSDIKTWGGALDVPIIRGTIATPEIALRGSYATLSGAGDYNLKVYGVEAFISKGFGPVTPYGAVGRMRSKANGSFTRTITPGNALTVDLADTSNVNRYTAGVRLSLLVPKIAVEVTKAEVTSYAAKVSFGF